MTVAAEPKVTPARPAKHPLRYLLSALIVLAILSAGALAIWGRGRGYKTWAMEFLGIDRKPAPRHVPLTIKGSLPTDGERNVRLDTSLVVKLSISNTRIDLSKLDPRAVQLIRADDGTPVATVVRPLENKQLILHPIGRLSPNTRYTLRVTRALRDNTGSPATPYSISFTTAEMADPSIRFEKVALSHAMSPGAGFTCVRVGPDHRLYAGTDDGRIFRFTIEKDGTVGAPQVITSLLKGSGGPRLLIGFCFDPSAPPDRPVLWVTHNAYSFSDAPDWTGTLSRMSGTDLSNVQHVLVHLPRSWRDHLTNQPRFGPDGALYFPQGSNTSYGAPDDEWGQRVQHLLCATILRLDVSKLDDLELPLDVKTPDGGGSYDPTAPGAPLTIYASGVRNAYSLLWHSNGKLYAPVNGSQPGGNTPAGPGVPALLKIAASENDWLFKITAPGRYFGHPNDVQKHFVLNGGNPTARRDPFEIPEYPVGTRPDPAWTPPVFDFGAHISPNGVIEYTSDAFGGKLKHRLMVCRYNIGADIIVLALDENGDVRSSQIGIAGLGNLDNPLDLAEDPRNGNLYVSEYGRQCITLLRPLSAGATITSAAN